MAMRQRLSELHDVWLAEGIAQPLQCRMGIHTDYCTVGNFGSENRLDYTIIGRGVNTAARLESRAEPGETLISYETFALVASEFECRDMGEIEVKGLAYPIATYQVLGAKAAAGDENGAVFEEWQALAAKAPAAMTARERKRAIAMLSHAPSRRRPTTRKPGGTK
jgi:class 3 adenylate cyclase